MHVSVRTNLNRVLDVNLNLATLKANTLYRKIRDKRFQTELLPSFVFFFSSCVSQHKKKQKLTRRRWRFAIASPPFSILRRSLTCALETSEWPTRWKGVRVDWNELSKLLQGSNLILFFFNDLVNYFWLFCVFRGRRNGAKTGEWMQWEAK